MKFKKVIRQFSIFNLQFSIFMRCPYCKSSANWKMRTPGWVRYTPGPMRNMRCSDCGHEYIKWFGIFAMFHKTARIFVFSWWGFWIAAFFLSLAWHIPKMF